jgi:hypothetical protein
VIVETGLKIRAKGDPLKGYFGVLALSPRTFGSWTTPAVPDTAVPFFPPPKPVPSVPRIPVDLSNLRIQLRALVHRRHRTYGLPGLWPQFQGRIPRAAFRDLAADVRADVKRERRRHLQRYQFLHPDVAHSFDYTELPRAEPGAPKLYLAKMMDDFARLKLKHALTHRKGAVVGGAFVDNHLSTSPKPLVLKFDLEFDTPEFYDLLLRHRVVPLPSPAGYPAFNAKTERSYRDVKDWLREFEGEIYWTREELETELELCFKQSDEIDPRPVLGGFTARAVYDTTTRAALPRELFFSDAVKLFDSYMRLTPKAPRAHDAWRCAAKETLKKYGLVRYSRP